MSRVTLPQDGTCRLRTERQISTPAPLPLSYFTERLRGGLDVSEKTRTQGTGSLTSVRMWVPGFGLGTLDSIDDGDREWGV